jgi:deoxyribonuclease-4
MQLCESGVRGFTPWRYEGFRYIMNDKRFEEIPLILETIDNPIWDKEIRMLYGMEENRSG